MIGRSFGLSWHRVVAVDRGGRLEGLSLARLGWTSNAAAGDRWKFTAREYDPETGLYFFRARYYNPASGRFTSQDRPGLLAGDANLYRYCGNRPLEVRLE